jgi:hypothetical protein
LFSPENCTEPYQGRYWHKSWYRAIHLAGPNLFDIIIVARKAAMEDRFLGKLLYMPTWLTYPSVDITGMQLPQPLKNLGSEITNRIKIRVLVTPYFFAVNLEIELL